VFLYGFVLIMGRLAAPWQLIRIAARAAETDEAARIAETPYARAVTIVLGEVECMVGDLRGELKARRPVTSLLKNIHMRRAACARKSICPATRRGADNSRPSAPKSPMRCVARSSRPQAGSPLAAAASGQGNRAGLAARRNRRG